MGVRKPHDGYVHRVRSFALDSFDAIAGGETSMAFGQ
jgi:hypothetical protein